MRKTYKSMSKMLWKPFQGEYEKQPYDIMLHDGTIIVCWPNAGVMHQMMGEGGGRYECPKDFFMFRPAIIEPLRGMS